MSDTIEIAGIKIPRPIASIPQGETEPFLYMIDLQMSDGVLCDQYDGSEYHMRAIFNGIVHLDEDAAKLHAKALVKLNHGFVCPSHSEEVAK